MWHCDEGGDVIDGTGRVRKVVSPVVLGRGDLLILGCDGDFLESRKSRSTKSWIYRGAGKWSLMRSVSCCWSLIFCLRSPVGAGAGLLYRNSALIGISPSLPNKFPMPAVYCTVSSKAVSKFIYAYSESTTCIDPRNKHDSSRESIEWVNQIPSNTL